MPWTFASASALGAIHDDDEVCQDSVLVEAMCGADGSKAIMAVVSDGAGSALKGQVGSQIVCETFRDEVSTLLQESTDLVEWTDFEIGQFVDSIQKQISRRAEQDQAEMHEYSATMVGLVATENQTLFIQVGDGASVWSAGDEAIEVGLWPEESEFANTTFFVNSPEAKDHLHIRRESKPLQFACLFSDGLQYLVLDFKDMKPHTPFFEAVEKRLKSGNGTESSKWLEAMLSSPQVTNRTDDDTSIAAIIARGDA